MGKPAFCTFVNSTLNFIEIITIEKGKGKVRPKWSNKYFQGKLTVENK